MVRVASAVVAWLLLVLVLLPPTHSDIVFRVPEVSVRPVSGAKAVGIGQINASGPLAAPSPEPSLQYEEYFVEHDVSAADARKAAKLLNLNAIPATRVGCGPCNRRELEYCESRVLSDHCCCERQFLPEPFPWLPHTCYVGPHRCRPLAHDCAKYARLRDCCCYKKLAERWHSILSDASPVGRPAAALHVMAILLSAAIKHGLW